MEFYKKEWFKILSFSVPFLVIILSTGLNYELQGDEKHFFYPTIKQFGENWLPSVELLRTYEIPEPPVPFLIFGLIGKIFNFNLKILRLFNMSISFLTIVVFYKLLRRIVDFPYYLSFLFLLFPYYLVLTSSLVYTEPIGLLFAVLASYFYIFKEENLLGGFFAGLALLCRQFFVFIPITFIAIQVFSKKGGVFKLRNLINFLLPFLMYLPFFLLWGGVVPQGSAGIFSRVYFFNFAAFNYVFIMIAIYTLPFITLIFPSIFSRYRLKLLFAFCLSPLYLLGLPTKAHPIILNAGPYFKLVYSIRIFGQVPFYLAWLFGLFVLLSLIDIKLHNADKIDSYCIYSIIFFCFMMLFTPYMWEKYILTIFPLFLIFFGRRTQRIIWLMILWIIVFISLSITSFIYYLILNPL